MLLSLERANARALLFTRLIATFAFFVEIFLFLFQSHSCYANQKKVEIFLTKLHKSYAKQFLEVA